MTVTVYIVYIVLKRFKSELKGLSVEMWADQHVFEQSEIWHCEYWDVTCLHAAAGIRAVDTLKVTQGFLYSTFQQQGDSKGFT